MTKTLRRAHNRTTLTASNQEAAPLGRMGRMVRHDPGHDAAELASNLRALALRAYRLLKDRETHLDSGSDAAQFQDELKELRDDIVRLQTQLADDGLDSLIPYVSGLRWRVESYIV